MKFLICSAIRGESLFVIKLNKEMLFHLKEGIIKSKELNKIGFNSSAFLTIPYEENDISLYELGTVFRHRLEKSLEQISPEGIEYLLLEEAERFEFAKKYNLPYSYILLENIKNKLKNLQHTCVGGRIIIENGNINFELPLGLDIMSETISYDFIRDNIFDSI